MSRFEWGGYENSLYAYSKNPTARGVYRKSLIDAIERGGPQKRIAPGLHAELGYLALEDGDSAAAIKHFEAEMALFPESRMFMERVIARISKAAPAEGKPS